MQRCVILALLALPALAAAGFAQVHKVEAPEAIVRAVGVYEWIGDRTKPTASRFVPVTVFIDGNLEDAGVYLARPIPFALESGTLYEVDRAGVPEGTVAVTYVSHLQPTGAPASDGSTRYDDGWFGYGPFSPPPPPKKAAALKASKTPSTVESSKPDTAATDRPTFTRKPDEGAATKPANPEKPVPDKSDADKSDADKPDSKPDDDPGRPHMSRRPEPPEQPENSSTASPAPANDPDRPTLRKRSPEETKKARKAAQESSASGLATSLNVDPDRPTLHRGSGQQALNQADMPKLKGVPADLHQAAAVSDAKARPTHDFSRPWTDDAERASVLAVMQQMAQSQIAEYRGKAMPSPKPQAAARSMPNGRPRRPKPAQASPGTTLLDEHLSGFVLSYGGPPTYVYTARTEGEGAALVYVTVVAQRDALGQLQPALESVTDATHLDRTPWMRLVDAVDADASNRASLLFEMRGEFARQFALYRVIGARSEQIFLTGTTQ